MDPVALREFAAKTAPETPPGEALNRLYSFCENNGSLLELEDAFMDTHPSWFLALDHTMQKLGIPECLSLSNLICAQVPPFPIHIMRKFALVICREKMLRLWRINLSMWNPFPMRKRILMKSSMGWFSFGNAVETLLLRKRILFSFHWIIWMRKRMFLPLIFSASPSSSSPHLGQIQFFATVLALPGIGYYLGAMQLGPLLFGKISAEEFAEKWRNLFSMQIGLFLIVLPLIFYILLLTSIWGKFTGKIRKRLLLGSLLTGVLSYIALGAHYGALVNSLGMSLLIGAFVYWLRREG
ncbi:MAG: hypothetical protein L6W00_14750 [Lentisphaeria bacterium]|nr:MAG: hypothetical protein L6W00_14750 [Lentisphaeria bacterium]